MTILQKLQVVLCCAASLPGYAQTTTTSFQTGQTVGTQPLSGTYTWTSTGNLVASDNSRARASITLGVFASANSDYVLVKNFGFSLPSYVSITGIEVEIEKRATGLGIGSAVRDNVVRLVRADTLTGTNQAISTAWTGSDQIVSYGGGSANWGTMWTAAEINSPAFGIAFSARVSSGAVGLLLGAELDMVRIRVHYLDIVLPIHFISFEGRGENEHARLKWVAETNEPGQLIIQKRAAQSGNWLDVADFDIRQEGTGTFAQTWLDPHPGPGAAYRLCWMPAAGAAQYSRIWQMPLPASSGLRLFPNPANGSIIVESPDVFSSAELFSISGRLVKMIRFPAAARRQNWDLTGIPAGEYLLKLNTGKSISLQFRP